MMKSDSKMSVLPHFLGANLLLDEHVTFVDQHKNLVKSSIFSFISCNLFYVIPLTDLVNMTNLVSVSPPTQEVHLIGILL